MVNYLMKTPLTALVFAAVWHFAAVFMPYSAGYSEVLASFQMSIPGYVFMIAYGLWLSIILALIFSDSRDKGIKLALFSALPVLFAQWLVPALSQLVFGETTGVMSLFDTVLELIRGSAATIVLLVLAVLLFKPEVKPAPAKPVPPKIPDKYKLKKLDFAIKLLVLPVIYSVIYFLVWYFVLWRSEAVRVFYSGDPVHNSFIQEMITMLLTNARLVPMALIKGLLYAACIITLVIQLAGKRVMFIIITVLLFAGCAARMMIPSPVMPDAVRIAHAVELAADAVIYGALAAFMLHTSILKEAAAVPHAAPAAAVKRAAPKSAAPKSAAPKPAAEK